MRYGLVSSAAVERVGLSGFNSSAGRPGLVSSAAVGAVGADHIDAPGNQRAGRGFSNAERDAGPADAGEINARANARQYGLRMKGKNPFTAATWKPEWFNASPMSWDDPPEPKAANAGSQSAYDRARRGET